jgi:hypothetical protein
MDSTERIDGDSVTRGVVPGRKVLIVDGPAAVVIAPPRLHAAHAPVVAPRIELVREGDVIRAIEVTCSCGEKIRLHCVYEGQAASA